MKQFRVLLAFTCVLALSTIANAQQRLVTTAPVYALPYSTNLNNYLYFGGTATTPGDSLQVSDSIAYLTPVGHVNDVAITHVWYWNKIGTGTATITLTYWWSLDNVNWFQCTQGVAETAYTKNFTLSASGWQSVDFQRDSIRFPGRFLKTYYITSATASVKGKLINIVKANIK